MLAHYRELAAATDVPLNADFENGLADDLDGLAENVTRCIATGVAGLSIEDSPNDGKTPLYDFDVAVARVKAARAAIDRAGGDVVFTARAEKFIRGVPDLDDAIRRLKAYRRGRRRLPLRAGHQDARADRGGGQGGGAEAGEFPQRRRFRLHGDDLAAMGVRRISVGGSLARVAMHAFIRTATEIAKRRQIRRLRRTDHQSRAEQVLRAKIAARQPRHDSFGTASANRPAGRVAGRSDNAGAASRAR